MERSLAGNLNSSRALMLAGSIEAEARLRIGSPLGVTVAQKPAARLLRRVAQRWAAAVFSGRLVSYLQARRVSTLQWIPQMAAAKRDWLRWMASCLGLNFALLRLAPHQVGTTAVPPYLITPARISRLSDASHAARRPAGPADAPADAPAPAPQVGGLRLARVRDLGLAARLPEEADHVQMLGNSLRDLRRRCGLSRPDAARLAACDVEVIVTLENGYGNLETAQSVFNRLHQLLK